MVTSKKKRRVTILADSHGKLLSNYMNDLREEFEVLVCSKPGAKLKHVIQDGLGLVKDFTENDCVIILAGTNDLHRDEPFQLTLDQGMRCLTEVDLRTNVLVCGVPYRHDYPVLNDNICYANSYLSRAVEGYTGSLSIHYKDINKFLGRSHFTRHGLHLGRRGKRILGNHLAGYVRDFVGDGHASLSTEVTVKEANSCVISSPIIQPHPAVPLPSSKRTPVHISIDDQPVQNELPVDSITVDNPLVALNSPITDNLNY